MELGDIVRHPLLDGAGKVVGTGDRWLIVRYEVKPPVNMAYMPGLKPVYRNIALKTDEVEKVG